MYISPMCVIILCFLQHYTTLLSISGFFFTFRCMSLGRAPVLDITNIKPLTTTWLQQQQQRSTLQTIQNGEYHSAAWRIRKACWLIV